MINCLVSKNFMKKSGKKIDKLVSSKTVSAIFKEKICHIFVTISNLASQSNRIVEQNSSALERVLGFISNSDDQHQLKTELIKSVQLQLHRLEKYLAEVDSILKRSLKYKMNIILQSHNKTCDSQFQESKIYSELKRHPSSDIKAENLQQKLRQDKQTKLFKQIQNTFLNEQFKTSNFESCHRLLRFLKTEQCRTVNSSLLFRCTGYIIEYQSLLNQLLLQFASILYRLGQFEKALQIYRYLIERNIKLDSSVYYEMAQCYYEIKNYAEVINIYKTYCNPDLYPRAFEIMMKCYIQLRDQTEAMYLLKLSNEDNLTVQTINILIELTRNEGDEQEIARLNELKQRKILESR